MSATTGLASREAAVLRSVQTDLFIGGEWRPSSDGRQFPVEDPATQEVIAQVADATVADGQAALAAAVAAQPAWAATAPRERGEILRRAFEMITARLDDLALLMTLEMGKPIKESRGELAYASEFFRWFAEEAVRIHGRYTVAPNGASRLLTMKQPVGPCLFITPWNFPMAMGTRKIGPAVAAGCTIVIKPASQTPLSMFALAGILTEAGLPPGVLNVVTTRRTGAVMEPLIRDPRLRKLSFTGSTGTGRLLAAAGHRATAPGVDGTRRQRPVPGLRRRRHRRRGRGCDAREDAEHGRGLRGRQPLPRARVGGRGVQPRGWPGGWVRWSSAGAPRTASTSGR